MTEITLRSEKLEVRVLAAGAALVGVRLAGLARNLVLGFTDPADHQRVPIYAGAVVGPVANRLRDGQMPLGGKMYQMPLNEAGRTTLHSGDAGLHARVWTVKERGNTHVTLGLSLSDGECWLPGVRHFTTTYHVDGVQLLLTQTATTDRLTAVNLAAHAYWNLDGAVDVSGHRLQIDAEDLLPTDALNLPTGARVSQRGSAFDFSAARPVPLDPALDVNFCLADDMRANLAPAATLRGSDGTTLRIETTAPGLQVYNGSGLPDDAPTVADFPPLAPYSALALEPQMWPDAPNHRGFPTWEVAAGATYRQQTRYTLSG